MAKGAEEVFRRWRRLRPDLPAQLASREEIKPGRDKAGKRQRAEADGDYLQTTEYSAGIRFDFGLHDLLPEHNRADSAVGRFSESLVVDLATVLADCFVTARGRFLPAQF